MLAVKHVWFIRLKMICTIRSIKLSGTFSDFYSNRPGFCRWFRIYWNKIPDKVRKYQILTLFQHKAAFNILTHFWNPSYFDSRMKVPLFWLEPRTSEVNLVTCIVWPADCFILYHSYFSYKCSMEFTAIVELLLVLEIGTDIFRKAREFS